MDSSGSGQGQAAGFFCERDCNFDFHKIRGTPWLPKNTTALWVKTLLHDIKCLIAQLMHSIIWNH